MLSFLTGRAGFREKPDSTFPPGALKQGQSPVRAGMLSHAGFITSDLKKYERSA